MYWATFWVFFPQNHPDTLTRVLNTPKEEGEVWLMENQRRAGTLKMWLSYKKIISQEKKKT
jgi:hypothetical protein